MEEIKKRKSLDRKKEDRSTTSSTNKEENSNNLDNLSNNEGKELKVVSLNCWGLKFVAKKREIRMNAISQEIISHFHHFDIIALQEIWVELDYLNMKEKIAIHFPHSRFFHSAALGGGLAIFSKYQIVESNFKPYSLNNSPLHILEGDWIVGKGAASVVIHHPVLDKVEIFNTHFCAGFGEMTDFLQSHRIAQAWEISKLIQIAAERGHHVIAMGDFNSTPESVATDILNRYAKLRDCWAELKGSFLPFDTVESDEIAIKELGITCNSPANSWSRGKRFDERSTRWRGKRLDYVFYRNAHETENLKPLHCTSANVCFTELVPGHTFSFSDHYGIAASFAINCKNFDKKNQNNPILPLTSNFCLEAAGLLKKYKSFAKRVSKGQLIKFAVADAFAICLVVGSVFQPKGWLNWIFPLAAIPTIWYAVTMFYTGFIYGRWEESAIQNVIEEMEIIAEFSEPEKEVDDINLAGKEGANGIEKLEKQRQHLSKEDESIAPSICQIL